jgi:hypothetical protein
MDYQETTLSFGRRKSFGKTPPRRLALRYS